jgi:GTP cyclohydrolase IA
VSAAAHPLPEEPTPLGSRRKLEVVGRSPAVDLVRAERAVAELLAALGQDPTSEELAETPRRVAASYAELLTPAPFTLTSFPNDEGYDEQDQLAPRGVGVVLEAEHLCMTLRGVQATGARTVTSALHGLLRSDPSSRQEFLALTRTAT